MESDAFKIPLRTNPSTLPNVFPTILCEEPDLQDKQKKACLLSPFWRQRVLSDQYTSPPQRRTGEDVEGPRDLLLLLFVFTDSIKQRVDQSFGLSVDTCSSAVRGLQSVHPRGRPRRLIAHFLHRYLRKYALFGVWSTVWVQPGWVVASGIWIHTV